MRRLLVLVPLGSTPLKEVEALEHMLLEVFEGLEVVSLSKRLPLPLSAFDWRRMQYVSPKILAMLTELKELVKASVVLGVCDADAYSDDLNFVFGEALLGQGVAVVYLRRLRTLDPSKYIARVLKECLHELGHAMGLTHCSWPGCVMNFSLSVADVDAKHAKYCMNCASRLEILFNVKVRQDYVLRPSRCWH